MTRSAENRDLERTEADFCFDGDHCPLVLSLATDVLTPVSDQHSTERISCKAELWEEQAPF